MAQTPKDKIFRFDRIDHEKVAKSDFVVELRSDAMTKPTEEMRKAMAIAQVGYDVQSEDPTVNELEEKMCQLFGKEAALFLPSGTMCNLIAVLVHCQGKGQEVIIGDQSHQFLYETGGLAQFGGVQTNVIKNEPDGTFSIEGVLQRIRPDGINHFPRTKLILVENTHTLCGGRVLPQEWIDQICKIGQDHNIAVHLDGSRIFNAAIVSKTPISRIVQDFSSVAVCLSKNLGAPIGSVLLGNAAFIKEGRRMRKCLGGAMSQSGIVAAAGIYSIENILPNLENDHVNAKIICQAVHDLKSPVISVDIDHVETNIFLLNTHNGLNAPEFCDRLSRVDEDEKKILGHSISVLIWPANPSTLRGVLHYDVTREMAEKAAQKICYIAKEYKTNDNTPISRIVQDFSSVAVCLSKNLGAPIGSVLLGNAAFIKEGRRMRKCLGGAMSQSGIVAAAGIYSIENILPNLENDHVNAKIICQAVHDLKSPVISVDIDHVETNIFLLNTHNGLNAPEFCDRLSRVDEDEKKILGHSISVLIWPANPSTLRGVLHYDVTREMAEKAAQKICYIAKDFAKKLNL